mgnify:FL=1
MDSEEGMMTMGMMEYKGYVGSIEFSEENNVFYGKIQNVSGLISYEGETERDLYVDFCGAVEAFLTFSISVPL